jgi:hypothetical protein
MWSRADFDALAATVPFPVAIEWDRRPSRQKYGHVNALFAVLRAFHDQGAAFANSAGNPLSSLTVRPLKRKLTDQKKRQFSIVGHETGSPLLIARLGELDFEVFFNQHLFVETQTTYQQYFPSASLILRPRNFLRSCLVPSPGSWGSDIISLTYDWDGTFILEAAASALTGPARKNFPGFKLLPVKDKHFLAPKAPLARERALLTRNGFMHLITGTDLAACWSTLSSAVQSYARDQSMRLKR